MTDDERLQQIKARCALVETEVMFINEAGDIDFAPAYKAAEIDGDIHWLFEQLEASQRRVAELEYALEMHVPNHPKLKGGRP